MERAISLEKFHSKNSTKKISLKKFTQKIHSNFTQKFCVTTVTSVTTVNTVTTVTTVAWVDSYVGLSYHLML